MQLHGFLSEKISKKKDRKRVTPGWTDISGPGPVSFSSRSSMYYITLILHKPINLLNVVSTNSFTSLTTWCTNELNDWNLPSKQFQWKSICFFSLLTRVNKWGYFRLSLRIRKLSSIRNATDCTNHTVFLENTLLHF